MEKNIVSLVLIAQEKTSDLITKDHFFDLRQADILQTTELITRETEAVDATLYSI